MAACQIVQGVLCRCERAVEWLVAEVKHPTSGRLHDVERADAGALAVDHGETLHGG